MVDTSSRAEHSSNIAAAPILDPIHMVTTPNLQSLPRRFISFRRVATRRAPENTKNGQPFLQSHRSFHEKNSSSTITHLTGIAFVGTGTISSLNFPEVVAAAALL